MDTIELKPGDPCPACGGKLSEDAVPSPEQRARAEDREVREVLPPHMDSATEAQRAKLGARYRCRECGYQTRFPLDSAPAADVVDDDDEKPAGKKSTKAKG